MVASGWYYFADAHTRTHTQSSVCLTRPIKRVPLFTAVRSVTREMWWVAGEEKSCKHQWNYRCTTPSGYISLWLTYTLGAEWATVKHAVFRSVRHFYNFVVQSTGKGQCTSVLSLLPLWRGHTWISACIVLSCTVCWRTLLPPVTSMINTDCCLRLSVIFRLILRWN